MAINNLNLLGSIINIPRSNRIRNFDLQAILSVFYKSKTIINKYINTLDIIELISKLITLLLIRF
jgi:hypothetical protein